MPDDGARSPSPPASASASASVHDAPSTQLTSDSPTSSSHSSLAHHTSPPPAHPPAAEPPFVPRTLFYLKPGQEASSAASASRAHRKRRKTRSQVPAPAPAPVPTATPTPTPPSLDDMVLKSFDIHCSGEIGCPLVIDDHRCRTVLGHPEHLDMHLLEHVDKLPRIFYPPVRWVDADGYERGAFESAAVLETYLEVVEGVYASRTCLFKDCPTTFLDVAREGGETQEQHIKRAHPPSYDYAQLRGRKETRPESEYPEQDVRQSAEPEAERSSPAMDPMDPPMDTGEEHAEPSNDTAARHSPSHHHHQEEDRIHRDTARRQKGIINKLARMYAHQVTGRWSGDAFTQHMEDALAGAEAEMDEMDEMDGRHDRPRKRKRIKTEPVSP